MVELQVLTDLPSSEFSVTTPVTEEVGEIEEPSNISSSLPHVQPIESDVLQSSQTYNTAERQFDIDELINCSEKPSVHQENCIQGTVETCSGCSGDAVTNPTVTAIISRHNVLDIELSSVAATVELQVLTDFPSSEFSVTTPVTEEVGEIEEPLNALILLKREKLYYNKEEKWQRL
ncbi:uncharacterized protein LOC107884171 [Acyrthosiphon pisum]|uniref:Uncharacterized protein n=1 Tax=Acyrthosiphon pisum TaxID=7029 RepID=A0A8R2D4L2_ACYPI|nr:uncharacterized protein LOC107884171 [Acyrthosiphon pisum]|eukprot:XP_016661227.1 PREDICTED: uncharacterized protein LOC107884171 [Acyrthosiphon pisum]